MIYYVNCYTPQTDFLATVALFAVKITTHKTNVCISFNF